MAGLQIKWKKSSHVRFFEDGLAGTRPPAVATVMYSKTPLVSEHARGNAGL